MPHKPLRYQSLLTEKYQINALMKISMVQCYNGTMYILSWTTKLYHTYKHNSNVNFSRLGIFSSHIGYVWGVFVCLTIGLCL